MNNLLVVAGLALLVVLSGAPNALADDTTCVGFLVGGTHDNIVVPPGAMCTVTGAQVKGNIKAFENSRLLVFTSTVGGSIDGDKADIVQVHNSTVVGNIHIREGGEPSSLSAAICETTLPTGNIQVEKMTGGVAVGVNPVFSSCPGNTVLNGNIKIEENVITLFLGIGSNFVGQNLQVFKNTGTQAKSVLFNTAGESVQCTENAPPFVGGPNTAPKVEGQCFPFPPASPESPTGG